MITVPTINELYTAIQNDLKTKLGISSILGKTVLNAFAMVQAAKLKILYLLAANVYDNIFPDTADDAMLQRFGFVKLGRYQNPAVAGVYELTVTGTAGAVIPANTTYKSLDSSTTPNKLFVLDTDYTMPGTTGTIEVRAYELGSVARLEVGDSLQVTAPIALIDSFAVVAAVVTTPVEAENIEDYRTEIIKAYQTEAQGGARTDYRIWAADAAGVREVYPYTFTPGEITIYVEATPADSTDGNGTPPPSILTDVESVVEFDPDTSKPLNERGRRPISAWQINFLSITTVPIDLEITGLTDSSYIAAIQSAVVAFLYNIRPFIDGADAPADINKGKIYLADMYNIVRLILGANASFTALSMLVNSVAVDTYEFTGGNIPYCNSVTAV